MTQKQKIDKLRMSCLSSIEKMMQNQDVIELPEEIESIIYRDWYDTLRIQELRFDGVVGIIEEPDDSIEDEFIEYDELSTEALAEIYDYLNTKDTECAA